MEIIFFKFWILNVTKLINYEKFETNLLFIV